MDIQKSETTILVHKGRLGTRHIGQVSAVHAIGASHFGSCHSDRQCTPSRIDSICWFAVSLCTIVIVCPVCSLLAE